MDENNLGIRSLLQKPFVYNGLQNILGSRKSRQTIIKDFFKLSPGITVLDLGCGTGEILEFMPDNISYLGIDYNPAYIESAIKRFGNKGRFLCRNLTEAVDANEQFDRVIITGFLHHLNDGDAKELLTQAHKLVKKGGFLFCLENVRTEPQNPIARFLINRDRGQHVRTKEGYLSLFSDIRSELNTTIRTDLLRVPYSHIIIISEIL